MSCQLAALIRDLLNRFMGELVAKVAADLFTNGSKPIPLIVKSTGLARSQVVECLRALVKYNLATFEPSKNEVTADYKLCSENVLLFLRYPRYLFEIKSKFGTEAELIIEEILQNGTITAARLILNIARKYKDDQDKSITVVSLKDILVSLVNAGYVRLAPTPDKSEDGAWSDVPVLMEPQVPPGGAPILPELDVRALMQMLNSSADQLPSKPDDMYWRVNFERFHQDFRDDLMIKAISRRIDDNAAELMRHMLILMYSRISSGLGGGGIPSVDIRQSCRRAAVDYPLLVQYLEQYMKVIEDNSVGMVRVTGDASGGQYSVELRTAAARLVWELIEHTVVGRLGSDAARIFRLIRSKKYIEESDIQRYAMLPAKESKELTYKLMEEHFVSVQPMRKAASGGGGPSKAIYLYHIDLHQTACCVQERVYQALYNCGARAAHERTQHQRLLDKQKRVNTIVHGMRLRGESIENIQDMEDTITPPEKIVLQSIQKMLKQLSTAEIQLDRDLFILQWYFMQKS